MKWQPAKVKGKEREETQKSVGGKHKKQLVKMGERAGEVSGKSRRMTREKSRRRLRKKQKNDARKEQEKRHWIVHKKAQEKNRLSYEKRSLPTKGASRLTVLHFLPFDGQIALR